MKARAGGGARERAPPARYAAGFFAPSGFLPDTRIIDSAARFLAARGWRISAGDSVFARDLRFAGPDDLRSADLQSMATDRSLDVAIAARGGYGMTRLLGSLDFAAIAAAAVPVVGYSDFTAFNLALLARARAISFQGPSASDFAAAAPAVSGARARVAAASGSAGMARTAADIAYTMENFFGALTNAAYSLEFEAASVPPPPPALQVRGRLWGGNLSMMCSLLGTPYFPRVTGGILFVEDVNEPAYRIERMLLQLLQAGVLARQHAILLGDFTAIPALSTDNGFELASVWAALAQRCAVPLVGGLPFGHGRRRATLPVGAAARLVVEGKRVRLSFRGHPTVRERK